MKAKRLISLLLCLIIAVSAVLNFTSCNNTENPIGSSDKTTVIEETTGREEEPPKTPSELEKNLTEALKNYLNSENFTSTVQSATTTQARVPLLYLRYVDGTFYTKDNVFGLKKYLNYINDLVDDGKICDYKFSSSAVAAQGWYSIVDYLYSWSLIYNQYLQWCFETDTVDESLQLYIPMIEEYLSKMDSWLKMSYFDKVQYNGEEIGNPYSTGFNILMNFGSRYSKYPLEWWEGFLEIVAERTGSSKGHDKFLKAYKEAENLQQSELSGYGRTLMTLFQDICPSSRVAFGYHIFEVLPMIAANLGIADATPYCDSYMLDYYQKDENGAFIKDGGTPNWVGFSGRPLCGPLYRNNEKYDVKFEKTMQGYFPYTDGWNQPLDEMINMDRLCNFYNHTLNTGANVAPQYGLLYGMMNGLDMENYRKEVPYGDETGDEVFNVITLWRNNLKTDDEGNYIIQNTLDMAVAIAYLAQQNGIEAPSPLGVYSKDSAVIKF